MHYVNVYKKHQFMCYSASHVLRNYQRQRDSERLLHEPTTSDRFQASMLPTLSQTQTAEPIRIFSELVAKERKAEKVLKVCFRCFLPYFRAVLTASELPKQPHFNYF